MADGKVNVDITGNASNLINATKEATNVLKSLAGSFEGIGKTAVSSLGGIEKAAGGMVTGLAKIGFAAQGLKAIGDGAVSMGGALLKGNAALEMTTISFKTLLGSASAADDMIKQLTAFAASTPFELTGLESSTQNLLAFGFGAKDIIPLMTSMGDAISALGGTQANLDSLVHVMGQMRQEAHINAGDIMQMTNLGIPALQMLADHYHKTTGEMQDMVSKGLVPGTDAIKIFSDGMEKRYGGMMAAQSATFSGMLSNLKDWATATTTILTKPLFEPAKKALSSFLDFVGSDAGKAAVTKLAAKIQAGVNGLAKVWLRATDAFKTFTSALSGKWVDAGADKIRGLDRVVGNMALSVRTALGLATGAWHSFTDGLLHGVVESSPEFSKLEILAGMLGKAFSGMLPTLEGLVAKFLPLATAIFNVYTSLSPLNIAIDVLNGFLKGGLSGGLDALGKAFENIVTSISGFGNMLLDWVGQQGPKLVGMLAQWATNFVEWAAPIVGNLLAKLAGVVTTLINWIALKAPEILDKLAEWAKAFIEWVGPLIPPLLVALGNLALSIGKWIVDRIPAFMAQLGQWGQAFIDWIGPKIPGIINELGRIAGQVVDWIGQQLPVIAGKIGEWGSAFLDWVDKDVLPKIPGTIGTIASTIGDWIVATAGVIGPKLGEWGKAFIEWMGEVLPKVPGMLGDFTGKVLEWIGAEAGNLLPKFENEWAPAFWKWIGEVWPQVDAKLGEFMDSISNWFTQQGIVIHNHIGEWTVQAVGAIGEWTISMKNSLLTGIGEIGAWFGQLIGQMWSDWWTGWEQNGGKLVDGLIQGIGAAWSNLTASVSEKVTGLINFIKGLFGIQSPSTVFAAIGEDIVNGLLQGLNNLKDGVVTFFSDLKDLMVNAVKEAVENITGWLGALAGAFDKLIHGDIAGAFSDLKGYATGASGHLNGKFAEISNGAATWASNIRNSVANFGAALNTGVGLASAAMNGIAAVIRSGSSWGSLLVSAGVNIVQGLINGMHSMMGQVGAAAAALAAEATVNVRSGLKISSPSKVMEEIGQQTGAGLAQGIVGSTKDVIDAMAALVGSLNKKAVEGAVALSESLGKIASGIGSFSDTLTKLIDYKGLPGDVLKSFMQDMTNTIAAFMGVAAQFKAKAVAGAADLAEGFSKIFGAVGAAADAVSKLDKWKAVGEPAIKSFMADAGTTLQEWLSITGKFSVAAITGGGLLADAASKIGAAIGSMADGLAKTRDWVGVALVSMEGFAYNVNIITNLFTVYAARYNTDSLHAATSFADTTSKIGGAIGSMADGLKKVKDWVGIAVVSMEGFAYNVDIITNLFAVYSARYTEQNLKSASAFAEAAGKVTSIIGAAVQGLTALKDYAGANRDALSLFGSDLVEAVNDFQTASAFFKSDGLKAASDFAEAGGKVTGIIGKAVDGFRALDDYRGVAADKLTNFMADLAQTVSDFTATALNFKPEATAAAAAFAEGAGKITDGLGKGVELFAKLQDYKGVPQKVLTAFLSDVKQTIGLVDQMVAAMDTEMLPQVAQFGLAAGNVFDGLAKALTVFKGLEQYKGIPEKVITDLLAEINLVVIKMADLKDTMRIDLMDKAKTFAKAVDDIFSKLKGAVDVFKQLETYKNDTTKAMQAMLDGIVAALAKMAQMEEKAQELYDGAVRFAEKMKAAGQKMAEGMTAVGSGGGGTGAGTTSTSPFDRFNPGGGGGGTGRGFALGGLVPHSGIFTVGEFGPEQVWLPGGSRVASNTASPSYNTNSSTTRVQGNVYITIAPPAGTDERKIAQMVKAALEDADRLKGARRVNGF